MTDEVPATKTNPYLDQLAQSLSEDSLGCFTADSTVGRRLAEYVASLILPKNARIHDLTTEVSRLKADIARLGRVLQRHNAGVCKDSESPVDCAIRLLSPVRDDAPSRDRP